MSTLLMQPTRYKPGQKIAGKFLSPVPRGIHSMWDGGCSMGLYVREVPWSNKRAKPDEVATGLWDVNGDVVFANNSFLAAMPPVFMTGFFCDDFFKVLASPPYDTLLADLKESDECHQLEFTLEECLKFLDGRPEVLTNTGNPCVTEDLLDLDDFLGIYQSSVEVLTSYKLSPIERKARGQLDNFIESLNKRADYVGFILRHPDSEWRRGLSNTFFLGEKEMNLE